MEVNIHIWPLELPSKKGNSSLIALFLPMFPFWNMARNGIIQAPLKCQNFRLHIIIRMFPLIFNTIFNSERRLQNMTKIDQLITRQYISFSDTWFRKLWKSITFLQNLNNQWITKDVGLEVPISAWLRRAI